MNGEQEDDLQDEFNYLKKILRYFPFRVQIVSTRHLLSFKSSPSPSPLSLIKFNHNMSFSTALFSL